MEDLASEINKKQAVIDEFTLVNKKNDPNVKYILEKKIEAQKDDQPE